MRRYETVFIADPDIPEENRVALFERLKGLIETDENFIIRFDEWGVRKTAYEIKKKKRGFYVLAEYTGMGDLVQELERVMRIDDRVLKFLTVLKDEDANPEAIREEMAREEAEKEAKELERAEAKAAAEARKAEAEAEAEATAVAEAAKAAEEGEAVQAEEEDSAAPEEADASSEESGDESETPVEDPKE
ncbi:MAG: 30S ribosomal protein S6 [Proteobacteria bacterium]|nr:30S ribosomal protein S6 [Pseudomonadota bacterium]